MRVIFLPDTNLSTLSNNNFGFYDFRKLAISKQHFLGNFILLVFYIDHTAKIDP
jgi:hypothetical protein